jgi:hypothetical protein
VLHLAKTTISIMLDLRQSLINSSLRKVIKRIHYPLKVMMSLNFCVAFMLFGLANACAHTQDEPVYVGRFDATSNTISLPTGWQVIRFDQRVPATQYRVMAWDGVASVEATAKGSMALLGRPLSVDLQKTPVLCWQWRVDDVLKNANMATKQGDDYAARVYVSFRMPEELMGFTTRAKLMLARSRFGDNVPDAALNYVWDNRYPVGTRQANAYTDRTQMMVLRSGSQDAGHWVIERRNILLDVTQAFGTDRAIPIQLAVASDTDNTGESARAGFADLHFVARDAPCVFSGMGTR